MYTAIFACVCVDACDASCAEDDLCADVAVDDTDAVDTDAVDLGETDGADSDPDGDETADPDDAASCGCATTTPSAAWLVLLAGGLVGARRRR